MMVSVLRFKDLLLAVFGGAHASKLLSNKQSAQQRGRAIRYKSASA